MTRDELLTRMNAIMESPNLDDALMTEYEGHETALTDLNRREGLVTRHGGLGRAGPGIPLGDESARTTEDLGDTSYRAAFNAYLRTGIVNQDLIQSRAQSETVPSDGGYLVPDDYRARIVDRMVAYGGIAAAAETVTTGDGRRLPWVTLDDTANVGEIVAEGGTFFSGADLLFGSDELDAFTYASSGVGGNALRVSYELAADAAFDIASVVAGKLGERIGRLQAVHLVRGTGADQPLGVAVRVGVKPIAAALTYPTLLKFIHSVDPAYRGNSSWAFNDATLQAIRGLLDANGRPILKTADEGIDGSPGGTSLLGYPVIIDQAFPNVVLNDSTINWGVFGDIREGYIIRRVSNVELLVNPYSRMNFRQIEYSAWARMDATQQNTNAYVALTGFTV